ncbi:unnamed protein product [Eruca vesicaria subsp. sativa]|uniref:Uncharacterized protein n=1 Tax=Eruca vesicaria subsp. sativa TaxID=29727 RepID=A0ABC8JPY7_ERUVS|nr:unnamed protein product [Eruca vesicaria subsp. sativa]
MLSSPVSSLLFLLLLVFLIHMDDAFGAQTEIRKLKETINARRNLNGDDNRSSKMGTVPSRSIRCGGEKTLKNMATTYQPDHHGPIPGGYLSSLCQPCSSYFSKCYTFTCTTTESCQSINGSPPTCTRSENCVPAFGN